jgi:hypothetical protein
MLTDLADRAPINKSAALVVNQSGCNDQMTIDDERDCLCRALRGVERQIITLTKDDDLRKSLGLKKLELQTKISKLNKIKKMLSVADRNLDQYIVNVCKSNATKAQWNEILCKARALKAMELKEIRDKN